MKDKLIKTLCIATLVLIAGVNGLHAQSNDRGEIDRPGYSPGPVTKTLIFNITTGANRVPLYRASVECDYARLSIRKRTDSTGTAPMSFSVQRGRVNSSMKATCVVVKSGYRPRFRSFDISRMDSPVMVEIQLSRERAR